MKRKATKPATKPKAASKRTGRGQRGLNMGAAARAASKGATNVNVARAAGSQARSRAAAAEVGRRLRRRLEARGQIIEAFAKADYDVERFAREVVEQASGACRTIYTSYEGAITATMQVVDWQARTAAREQYMRAVGMSGLPMEAGGERTLLSDLTNDDLLALRDAASDAAAEAREKLAGVAGGAAGGNAAAGAGPPAGAQPIAVDRSSD